MNTDILIIGGGISGLHTAYQLQKRGVDFILVEARERLGGRVLSKNYSTKSTNTIAEYDANSPAYDLGPSWFWPGQTNMENLVNDLTLEESVFTQQASGQSIYEDQQGNIQKGFYGISMEGTYRINGGMQQIIAKLEKNINSKNILKSAQAKSIKYIDNQIVTSIQKNNSSEKKAIQITSKKLVIALPPRIAMTTLQYKPSLPKEKVSELNSYATWMAGHAKILIVYSSPFWLEAGLSGDAVSHLGPLREIHDASSHPNSNDKSGFALFGFVGIPGSYRKENENEIRKATIDQLVRLFGKAAANPIDVTLQDWAQEKFTATEIDQSMNGWHATSSISHYTESTYDDKLIWSGTETADHRRGMNGLLEGALEASIRTLNLLT